MTENNKSLLAFTGNVDPVCPYCKGTLAKKPGRKKQCPHCGNYIYVRTRPVDRKKVLVTEAQTQTIEEQWTIVNGTHDEYLARKRNYEITKLQLAQKLGRDPVDVEVKWALLTKEAHEHVRNEDWGLYRNARFNMAEILIEAERFQEALSVLFEVCYFDVNGASNTGGTGAEGFLPDTAFLAPGVIGILADVVEHLEFNEEKTKHLFFVVAEKLCHKFSLPVSPNKAWNVLSADWRFPFTEWQEGDDE